jgi:hypothetical protein
MNLKEGAPCGHAGCLSHTSHVCEGCGRINGITKAEDKLLPCPCGGTASRTVSHEVLKIECDKCGRYFANHVRFGCLADSEWNTWASS